MNKWDRCSACEGLGKILLLYSRVDCDRCEGTGKWHVNLQERLVVYLKTPEGRRKLAEVLTRLRTFRDVNSIGRKRFDIPDSS